MRTPEQIVAELKEALPILEAEGEKAMRAAVDLTKARFAETAPRGRTGRLSENVSAVVRHINTGVSGTVRPLEKYARFVDKGTGLQVEFHGKITPKRTASASRGRGRPALRFAPAGDVIFRKSTKGQKPTNFVERTRQTAVPEAERILVDAPVHASARTFR